MRINIMMTALLMAGISGSALLTQGCTGSTERSAGERPNIILIYADDLGWSDVGANGARYYMTPNIDRLAASGVNFTSAYAMTPVCRPARAALQTGQYSGRTGCYQKNATASGPEEEMSLRVPPNNNAGLTEGSVTIGDALQAAGYQTAYIGKWDLADSPNTRGYPAEESFATGGPWDWAHHHYNPVNEEQYAAELAALPTPPRGVTYNNNNPFAFLKNKDAVPEGTYLSDYLTDKSIEYIESHHADSAPFFLMLSHFVPHIPVDAPATSILKYKNRPPDGGDQYPAYAGMIDKLDESVGRIIDTIAELGIDDNTIVIFSSDNGGHGSFAELTNNDPLGGSDLTDNAPLRGGKCYLYEGGVRVPLIVSWPGVIPDGSRSDEPVAHIDFFPTCLELAGSLPSQLPMLQEHPLDGKSVVPLLKNPQQAALHREYIAFSYPVYDKGTHWRFTPAAAIRMGEWKLVEQFPGEETPGDGSCVELYNLSTDIGERRDLSKTMPEKASELQQQLMRWYEETGALLPERKPPADTYTDRDVRFRPADWVQVEP
jgi:arylsulfatase A-like enzyme